MLLIPIWDEIEGKPNFTLQTSSSLEVFLQACMGVWSKRLKKSDIHYMLASPAPGQINSHWMNKWISWIHCLTDVCLCFLLRGSQRFLQLNPLKTKNHRDNTFVLPMRKVIPVNQVSILIIQVYVVSSK